ncbi:MAG TPA: sigma 54-interacting transcriptional regulator [Acidobacteriota bacterium]|nr:sigma 54-interacting transcriptional regulator [Acidobacteriota bacterium]
MRKEIEIPLEDTPEGEARRLATLLEISQVLTDTVHFEDSLDQVEEIVERHPSVISFHVLVPDRGRQKRGGEILPLDKTAIDRVIQSGEATIANRTRRDFSGIRGILDEYTLIAIPVVSNSHPVGATVARLVYRHNRNFQRALKFFRVVSSMIGQSYDVNRLTKAERERLMEENTHLRGELRERYDFSRIIGNSQQMREVCQRVRQVARADTTVLIRGESGTGKELIAHAIHYNSLRSGEPFIRVSCAALPETLIESELFGHEKGSFTGAQQQKPGRFEMAGRGTLFLDEIGELAPALQVKLLRVLQEREFERVGGTSTLEFRARLVAATNKNLEEAIVKGIFRDDLYYRLNVFSIFVPPLRERKSDILLLAEHFLDKYSRKHSKAIRRISTPAIDMLTSYHWPGNVRELENAIERAILVCDGYVIHSRHLPPTLQTAESSNTEPRVNLGEAVAAFEKDLIQDALKSTRGNRAQAARLLSTTERIIGYKVRKYAIDCQRFRT